MVGPTKYTDEQVNFVLDRTIRNVQRGQTTNLHLDVAREFGEEYGIPNFGLNQVRYVTERYGWDPDYGNRWGNLIHPVSQAPFARPPTEGETGIRTNATRGAKKLTRTDNKRKFALCTYCDGTGVQRVRSSGGPNDNLSDQRQRQQKQELSPERNQTPDQPPPPPPSSLPRPGPSVLPTTQDIPTSHVRGPSPRGGDSSCASPPRFFFSRHGKGRAPENERVRDPGVISTPPPQAQASTRREEAAEPNQPRAPTPPPTTVHPHPAPAELGGAPERLARPPAGRRRPLSDGREGDAKRMRLASGCAAQPLSGDDAAGGGGGGGGGYIGGDRSSSSSSG